MTRILHKVLSLAKCKNVNISCEFYKTNNLGAKHLITNSHRTLSFTYTYIRGQFHFAPCNRTFKTKFGFVPQCGHKMNQFIVSYLSDIINIKVVLGSDYQLGDIIELNVQNDIPQYPISENTGPNKRVNVNHLQRKVGH